MKRYFLFLFYAFLPALQSYSQVETQYYQKDNSESVISGFLRLNMNTVVKKMPAFDLEKMRKEDAEMEGMDVPYRFGKGFDVSYKLSDGLWHNVDEGRVWTMTFKSDGALSLNYIFENMYLPDGACLFIVNQDETVVYGPVTSEVLVSKESTFLTDIIPGSSSTIFLFEPLAKINESTLTIKRVVHGYRGFDSIMAGKSQGESNDCNIDVACYPEHEKESDGVALVLLSNGNNLCSGSLLISTDFSFDPYFLTAFHCVDSNKDGYLTDSEKNNAENWMFKFFFKKTTCSGSLLATSYTYNKANFCSAWHNTDFALMKLKPSVSQNPNLTWLGWDKSGYTPSSGFGIHHPKGDVMKISIEGNQFGTSSPPGNYRWTVNFDFGIVEPGSSGSPVFNQNKRVVGQLSVGDTFDNPCYQTYGQYGKFNLSWTGGGSNDTRLSNWLDPLGTSQTTMDSFKPSDVSIFGKTVICDTANYVINGLPSSYSVNWSIDNSNYTITPSGNQCLVTYTGALQYSVANLTATIKRYGTTIKTQTKRIVMHGTTLNAMGWQYSGLSPNGMLPDRQFTIPASRGSITVPDKSSMDELFGIVPLPIDFVEIDPWGPVRPPVDLCGYGVTEINGGNTVYLSSTRFDGMDISFTGPYSPTYLTHTGSNVSFEMPYHTSDYSVVLQAHSESQCHDFCLTFNVVPLPGAASGDDMIWVSLDGSMLYVTFMSPGEPIGNGQYYLPSYSVTISKIPSGTQMYSNSFSGNQSSFSVNTSGWASGIYSIRIVQGSNVYTKTFSL